MCLNRYEMLCRKGRIIGVNTDGGFVEYIVTSENNVFKIPDNIERDVAASLATTTITPFHPLKEASLKLNELLMIFGASETQVQWESNFERKWE